jgi:SAM-dependent methyltransferase
LDKPEANKGGGAVAAPVRDSAATTQACRACGCEEHVVLFEGTDRFYQTTDKRFQIVECRRCSLIRLFPQPEPAELAAYYPPGYWFDASPAIADRLGQAYRRFVLRDHLHFAKRAIAASGETGVVLDVGCGGGLFLSVLAEGGSRVVGLDLSLDAAKIAWLRHGVPTVCASLSRTPFASESFTTVTMFHVLEHLYDPHTCVEEARRLLRPEGRLLVQVPNAASWQFLLLGSSWRGVEIPRHLLLFRPSDLEVLLDRCGFELVRSKHFSLRDGPACLATSLAPWLEPMLRRSRGTREGPRMRLFKDLLYLCLVVVCIPFALMEAACRAGAFVMVEARKRA